MAKLKQASPRVTVPTHVPAGYRLTEVGLQVSRKTGATYYHLTCSSGDRNFVVTSWYFIQTKSDPGYEFRAADGSVCKMEMVKPDGTPPYFYTVVNKIAIDAYNMDRDTTIRVAQSLRSVPLP